MTSTTRRRKALVTPKAASDESGTGSPEFEPAVDRHIENELRRLEIANLVIPEDPARLAVALMLKRALLVGKTTPEEAGRNGSVCTVVTPSADWLPLVRDEWALSLRLGETWLEGRRTFHGSGGSYWMACTPSEQPSSLDQRETAEAFACMVAEGRHIAGFTSDVSWLPRDLEHAADFRLIIEPLTPEDFAQIVFKLCGSASRVMLSSEEACLLTPRLLRLAYRANQEPDAYMAKLQDLLKRDQLQVPSAVVLPTSVRDGPTLDRLHGMDEAVDWGRAVARDLEGFRANNLVWADVDRGCLISGPSGCGKTLFARALASTCRVPLISGSYAQWLGSGSGHQGDLLKAMKSTFKKARAEAPSILFIDEVDSFPNRATVTHHYADWEIQVVNALLAEIDGVEGREGVILLAACNHPERLDPALVRSGRLDRHISMKFPGRADFERILREHLPGELAEASLSGVALAAIGLSGADCERMVRGARRTAREAGRDLALADLLAEVSGEDERTDPETWLVAVHEAGHAVAIGESQPDRLEALTMRASGDTGGETFARRNTGFFNAHDVEVRLVEMLAGRAAEEVFLNSPSSGAGGSSTSDLGLATMFATMSKTALGLDPTSGLVWSGMPSPQTLPSLFAADPTLSGRVRITLDNAYSTALNLVRRRRGAVEAVAVALMDRRALAGSEVAAIIAQHPADTGHKP